MGTRTEYKVTSRPLNLMVGVFTERPAQRRVSSRSANLAAKGIAILLIAFVFRAGLTEFVRIDVTVFVVAAVSHAASTGHRLPLLKRLISICLQLDIAKNCVWSSVH